MEKGNESSYPMWLNIACDELRVFGDFVALSQKIQKIPDSIELLVNHVLQRLNMETENLFIKHVGAF
jgi:hypothetical protein